MSASSLTIGGSDVLTVEKNDALSVDSLAVDGRLYGSGTVATKSRALFVSGVAAASIEYVFEDDLVEIGETLDSGERTYGASPQSVRKYRIRGTDDRFVAYMRAMNYLANNFQLDANAFPTDDGLTLTSATLKPLSGAKAWEFEATFATPQTVVEECDYEFSTTGKTARLTHSLATVSATPREGFEVVDFECGVNANRNGGFDGYDVFVPHAQTTITQSLPKEWLNRDMRIMLARLTGSINADWFDGYAPGELLFLGVKAKSTRFENPLTGLRDWYWRATYSFEASPNTTIPFGEELIEKRGWDYAWRATLERENDKTGEKETFVRQINVERVYPLLEFAALCIPVPD